MAKLLRGALREALVNHPFTLPLEPRCTRVAKLRKVIHGLGRVLGEDPRHLLGHESGSRLVHCLKEIIPKEDLRPRRPLWLEIEEEPASHLEK